MRPRYVCATAPTVDPDPRIIVVKDNDIDPATVSIPDNYQPFLVTVPNVEIIEVGEGWQTSTGEFSFDEDDLVSAIESQDDPGVRTPVLKLGHVDPRFDGQPSFGRLANLRLTNNNQTLVCDLVGVPKWLADIMPSAYPRRSFEGRVGDTIDGREWPLIVDALALLGDAYPAINTLEDLPMLYGEVAPPLVPVEDIDEIAASNNPNALIATRMESEPVKWRKHNGETSEGVKASARRVAAQATLDDVRQAFYESLSPMQMWWWIRAVLINPMQLVVDDDENSLWLIDVTIDANDEVSFGEPSQVKVEYVAAAKAGQTPVLGGQLVAASYASPTEAGARVRATLSDSNTGSDTEADGSEPDADTTGGEDSDVKLTPEVLKALGLPEDATEDQINEAVSKAAAAMAEGAEPTTPAGDDGNGDSQPQTPATDPTAQPAEAPTTPAEPQAPTVPEGAVLVDASQWASVQKFMADQQAAASVAAATERDNELTAAVKAGKFPRSAVDGYKKMWDAEVKATGSAANTKALISTLQAGLVPVAERGMGDDQTPGATGAVAASAYPAGWAGTVAANRARTSPSTRVKVGND